VHLAVDGKPVSFERGYAALLDLQPGSHTVRITALKNVNWGGRLALYGEGPGIARQALFNENEGRAPDPLDPIRVEPAGEPVLLRSFVRWGEGKRTHVVNVGDPSGVHYTFDMEEGALLMGWRGPFLETTQMWNSRGEEQTALPRGSVLRLTTAPTLAILSDARTVWPDSMSDGTYTPEGYTIGKDGRPTFLYRVGSVEVRDRTAPGEDGVSLDRELRVSAPGGADGVYARIAEGSDVRRLRDGSYAIDGFSYYVRPGDGAAPVIRERDGGQELLVPVRFRNGEATVSYSILW
jgi:hypothetical protein